MYEAPTFETPNLFVGNWVGGRCAVPRPCERGQRPASCEGAVRFERSHSTCGACGPRRQRAQDGAVRRAHH